MAAEIEFRDLVVSKPWGSEYLCYESSEVAIWLLNVRFSCSTSMHCHPNKHTGYVVLDGSVELSWVDNKVQLSAGEKINIFRRRFHATKAISHHGATLLEIESPVDKYDLVRLSDDYDRTNMGYESADAFGQRSSDSLWITDPHTDPSPQSCNGLQIWHYLPDEDERYLKAGTEDCLLFTQGGVEAEKGELVLGPGEVTDLKTLTMLLTQFKIQTGSAILRVGR